MPARQFIGNGAGLGAGSPIMLGSDFCPDAFQRADTPLSLQG
jgi:hypothetical protein